MFPQMRVYISGLRGIDKLNVCDNCKVDVGCTECFQERFIKVEPVLFADIKAI